VAPAFEPAPISVEGRRPEARSPKPATGIARALIELVAMKIYTRTGDRGETSLFDGTRVRKSDPRIDACGHVDELNAMLGLARASAPDLALGQQLEALQHDLFALGARLADPNARIAGRVRKAALGEEDVRRLEAWIDAAEAELEPLRRFILPGGSPVGAALHVARTLCRRAERHMVALGGGAAEPALLAYVNRLSDLLFVLARVANLRAGVPDVEW
jgi:cob(I)alamin adenosyltransferase